MKHEIGDVVQIKPGASAWMKAHNYWIHDWPESIDGMMGTITHDYTQFAGNDCHYGVSIEGVEGCGVHPQWLTANAPADRAAVADTVNPIVCPHCMKREDECDCSDADVCSDMGDK